MTDLEKQVAWGWHRGWSFTPLRGKIPIVKAWQAAQREPLAQAMAWARRGNVGLRTGANSGIAVIDIERDAPMTPDDFPATLAARTGGGGWHLYYSVDKPVKNSVAEIAPKVDVRGDRGQVVYVGSVHPDTGARYGWAIVKAIAAFPYDLLPKVRERRQHTPTPINGDTTRYAAVALQRACERVAATPNGARHVTLVAEASAIGSMIWAGWLTWHDAECELATAGMACGLPEHQVRRAVADQLRFGMENPTDFVRAKIQEVGTS